MPYGAPGWNRTSDPQLRRLMLYPTELRARSHILRECWRMKQAALYALSRFVPCNVLLGQAGRVRR